MKRSVLAAGVLAQCASLVAAHATFQQAGTADVDYESTCVRMPVRFFSCQSPGPGASLNVG